jgi:hypothetical protein
MDHRSKILASVFGVAIGYAVLAGVVYPRWIRPLLTLDERIAERQKELDKLLIEDHAVQDARVAYKAFAGRVGAFDAGRVETNIRERLNQLIQKYNFADVNVAPSRPDTDRKTGLTTSSITVSATGMLETTIAFLKDLAELPDLVRIGNVSLSPAATGRKGSDKDYRINFRVPIEVWVLSQQRVVGALKEDELVHPPQVVRHASQDYSRIVASKFMWDYVPPVPLRAAIARPINVEKGTPATLEGSASGGDGEYTISWSPTEGLSDPSSLRPTVDTSAPGNKQYTLTVADGTGNSTTASTSVLVREPPPKVVEAPKPVDPGPKPPPPPPPGPTQWVDGRNKEIRMALLRSMGPERLDEFMVYDNKSRQSNYYKVGDDFDGGELVYVHQLGGVVKWGDGYFVYPLGLTLDRRIDVSSAGQYPELQNAAARIRLARTPPKSEAPESKAVPKTPEVTERKDEQSAGAEPEAVPPTSAEPSPPDAAPDPPTGQEATVPGATPPTRPVRARPSTRPGVKKRP